MFPGYGKKFHGVWLSEFKTMCNKQLSREICKILIYEVDDYQGNKLYIMYFFYRKKPGPKKMKHKKQDAH